MSADPTSPDGPIAVLIGTRPEAIKLMPVIRALERAGQPPAVYLTGQHDELLRETLDELEIAPLENLGLMQPDQSLAGLAARLLVGIDGLLTRRRPRLLLVQGDTSSAAMAALAAFYQGIGVAHVEAGLRTGVRRNPFPEEMNRRLVGALADWHFAPTERARDNLLREGVNAERVRVVGNTVIDALFYCRDHLVARLPPRPRAASRMVLVTAHRRESFGPDLAAVCRGIRCLAEEMRGEVEVVFPVHLNPNVQAAVRDCLGGAANLSLLPPVSYLRFVQMLLEATLVITDSGGVQEEAAALGIPLLVVRRTTERPEALESGVGELVGPDAERIAATGRHLLTDPEAYRRRAVPTQAFGDGHAAERIVAEITRP